MFTTEHVNRISRVNERHAWVHRVALSEMSPHHCVHGCKKLQNDVDFFPRRAIIWVST